MRQSRYESTNLEKGPTPPLLALIAHWKSSTSKTVQLIRLTRFSIFALITLQLFEFFPKNTLYEFGFK
jgi:hypothetical protein